MQHKKLTWEAALNRTPVVECLNPLLGDSDRVYVVPVTAEWAATQTSAE